MRELKFRGMDIKGNWHYGYVSILKNKVNHVEPGAYISNSYGMPFAYQVRPETVGQYTCLKDKNGKEIYEGDILGAKKRWFRIEVGFDNGFFSVHNLCPLMPLKEYLDRKENNGYKLIGNGHENPELLKERKK